MAIKEVLELVGSDVVIKQLGDVKKAGEESLATFNKPLPELKFPTVDAAPTSDVADHVVRLKDALHTLKPILQAAGVQIGEFGSFARLASGSILGLAVALGGAVVVGLAKLEENAARTKGILTDLFGSSDKGEAAFAALGKQAKEFGTTVDGLAPVLESFQTALNAVDRTAKGFVALKAEDLPGAQLAKNADTAATAVENFIKILRAGRLTQDDAQKSAKAFFDTLKEGGTVTSAALKNLPVGTINLLKEALGAAGLSTQAFFAAVDQGAIGVDKLQQALLAFGPQAQKAFDTKAIKTFSDEIGRLLASLNKGFEQLTGKAFSDFVIGEISHVRQGIESSIEELKKVVELIRRAEEATGSPEIGQLVTKLRGVAPAGVTTGPTLEQAGLFEPLQATSGKAGEDSGKAFNEGFLKTGFVFAGSSLQQLGAAGVNAGKQIASGIDQASASLQSLRDKAKETGQELEEVVSGSTRFKGRLNQIPVFEPQLAGEAGATAGAATGKKFVEAVTAAVQEGAPALIEPVKNIIETGLVVPAEAQALITNQFAATGTQSAERFVDGFAPVSESIMSTFQALYQRIVSLFAQPIPVNFQSNSFLSGQPTNLATGGMVRGPGSTTSDSIMAWLSNREFVVNAKAVSHYGPDFFAALNAMRLPQNFNMGGMARMMAGNKFAGGGMVKGNPVVLNIDRKSFNMTAGDDTITQLKRFAVASQLSSTGRKPRWVK